MALRPPPQTTLIQGSEVACLLQFRLSLNVMSCVYERRCLRSISLEHLIPHPSQETRNGQEEGTSTESPEPGTYIYCSSGEIRVIFSMKQVYNPGISTWNSKIQDPIWDRSQGSKLKTGVNFSLFQTLTRILLVLDAYGVSTTPNGTRNTAFGLSLSR